MSHKQTGFHLPKVKHDTQAQESRGTLSLSSNTILLAAKFQETPKSVL